MAIYKRDIVDIDMTGGSVFRTFLCQTIGEGDGEHNCFGVRIFRDGQPIALTGCQVLGQFIRPNGDTVVIGPVSAEGNEAAVTLPKACYAYEGTFQLSIKIFGLDFEGTVRIIDGMIVNTTNGNVIDPGSVIPSLADYQTAVAAAQAAAAAIANYQVTAEQVSGDNYNIVVTTTAQSS